MAAIKFTRLNLPSNKSGFIGVAYIKTNNYSTENKAAKAYNLGALKRGTGGRSSFNGIVATVFGATGFVGPYLINKLGKIGTQIIIPYRGDTYDLNDYRLCGDLGQVLFHPFYLRDEASIRQAVKYSNVVVNLIGRDWETKNFKYNDVNVEGPKLIARVAKEMGVERLIHLSALNASADPPGHVLKKGSRFLQSKYYGELAVLEEFPNATIIRPADIYGQEDRFLGYLSHWWRHQRGDLPLWKKGKHTIKQPVAVSDVAQAIVNAIKDVDTAGNIYQAVGPSRYILYDLMVWFHKLLNMNDAKIYDMRFDPIFPIKLWLTNRLSPSNPVANMHWDRVERECVTDIVDRKLPTLEDLGVALTHMEDQIPWELKVFARDLYYDSRPDLDNAGYTPPKVG